MQHFINHGYGWTCRHCSTQTDARVVDADARAAAQTLPRFFTEGEAEERDPKLSAPALARWRDDSRQALFCPHCGVEEALKAPKTDDDKAS